MKSASACFTIGALLLAGLAPAQAGAALTAQQVLQHIQAVGPEQAIGDYYGHPEWEAILQGVASAKPEWLQAYSALETVADSGAGEDLGKAIFEAIPSKPFKVLPLLTDNGTYTYAQACTFSFDSAMSAGEVQDYLRRLERALA